MEPALGTLKLHHGRVDRFAQVRRVEIIGAHDVDGGGSSRQEESLRAWHTRTVASGVEGSLASRTVGLVSGRQPGEPRACVSISIFPQSVDVVELGSWREMRSRGPLL